MTKTLTWKYGNGLELTLTVEEEDYQWVKELFARNSHPFKALRDLGYRTRDETEDKDFSQSS